ncbi:MAG: hypothetical protein NC311_06685 [Muribaculaceae bacterium]|nr:hypothetical protein [Muribaculaceae bacterium]
MGMENILREPEGAPITVFSVQLYQQWKHRNAGKDDMLFITYKDKDHKKCVRAIKNPVMEIYFAKPEVRQEFLTAREYIEMEKTYSKTVRARQVLRTIYNELKDCSDRQSQIMKTIYDQAYNTDNRQAAKEIFKWPYTLMSDMSVEEYYRVMLGYHYDTLRNHIIDKAYLDIEADIFGLSSSEQAANMDKVNACTVIFNFDSNREVPIKPQVFTFLLRDHKRYPQQKDFEDRLDEFIETCHQEFDHQTVTKDGKKRVIDFVADYHIKMYDNERDLLCAIFETINQYRPDMVSIWNIAYDVPKMAARMELNGLNYVDVMCDPSFPKDYRFVEMNIDNRASIDIADRKTFIRMASTTCWNDQMQSYAGIRKGRKAYGSNKLDNISNIELGVGKLQFPKGVDVTNAAIKAYWTFVLYNITDVMRQVLIDIVTNDSMSMVYDMNQSNCSLENLTKQTRYQKQIYYVEYMRRGFIPGNNVNINYIRGESEEYLERLAEERAAKEARIAADRDDWDGEEDIIEEDPEEAALERDGEEEETYDKETEASVKAIAGDVLTIYDDSVGRKLILPGGMVGDPDYNSTNGTELIEGIASKHVFDQVMDMDYASEYPWAKFTRSLSRSTQIGRLIIPKKISERQNTLPMGQEKRIEEIRAYLPGAEFTADYISHDILALGNVWFGLPTVTEMDKMLTEATGGTEVSSKSDLLKDLVGGDD